MAIIQCTKGHFYDNTKHKECPNCVGLTTDDDSTTIAVKNRVSFEESSPKPPKQEADDEKTVAFLGSESNFDPVVGWLVCVQGPERGRDYRLHAGQNFLGRSLSMSVAIKEDKLISRDRHCSIIFDPKSCKFYLMPEAGNAVMKNDVPVIAVDPLEQGDRIEIGESILVFIPFCSEGNEWI